MEIQTPIVLERNWGDEVCAIRTGTHAGKVLTRKAGTKGGFQCHVKEESHFLMTGRVQVRIKVSPGADQVYTLTAPVAWTVPPLTVHQEEALTDCTIVEVSDPTTDDRYALEPDPGGLPSMTDAEACAKLQALADAHRRKAVDCEHLKTAIQVCGLKGLTK